MKIIGHRGAAGQELENTLASLKRAKDIGVDGVELDVRLTKDRQFVLCHDADLGRVSNSKQRIQDLTLKDLKKISLSNGEKVPTLAEALTQLGSTWAIVEVKVGDCAEELLQILDQFPRATITVASFDHSLGTKLEELQHELSVFLAEHTKPFEIIHFVRTARADGLVLNAGVLNPLTYWLARRRGLEIMVYTVNSPFVGWFIGKFYPMVSLCTDYPERFIKNRLAN